MAQGKKPIPKIGMGTWQLTDKKELLNSLESAYQIGYRHIDTAAIYGNEEIIGEFIRTKNREDLFITTKLWCTEHENVEAACNKSLGKLGIEQVDLYLVHWPVNFNGEFKLRAVWEQMEGLVNHGKARYIGVSNFGVKNLKKLLEFCTIRPAVNQIELHPYMPQKEVREFCRENGIQVTSYSCLGSSGENGGLREDPVVKELAKKYNTTACRVLIGYAAGVGCIVIPRSRSAVHLKENYNVLELTGKEIDKLDSLEKRKKCIDCKEFGESRFD